MNSAELLKSLFDEKKIRVLQVFITEPTTEFTLKDIVEKSNVPLATTHRILKTLSKEKLLQRRKIKHLTTYKLAPNENAQFLSELLYERPAPLARFIELIGSLPGIQQVIMHGDEGEDRANIVITGTGIAKEHVNAAVALIQEEMRFRINHLILDPQQYEMLESMGQFSGEKSYLFP